MMKSGNKNNFQLKKKVKSLILTTKKKSKPNLSIGNWPQMQDFQTKFQIEIKKREKKSKTN